MYVFKPIVKDRVIRFYRVQCIKHNGHGILMDSGLKIIDSLLTPGYSIVRIISSPLVK